MPLEGFWYSDSQPELPKVVPGEPWERQTEFITKLISVQKTAKSLQYRGCSLCRICNKVNGSITYQCNDWQWPQGYIHYITEHNVKPSKEFRDMINEAFQNR